MDNSRNPDGTWKPGYAPNPAGRVPMSPELKAIKKLSPGYLKLIIAKLARMTPQELILSAKDPGKLNNLEMMVASIVSRAIQDGDHSKLNFLLDRSIGKVVEERRVILEPVIYKTTIRGDGALVQEVMSDVLGEEFVDIVAGDTKKEEEVLL